MIQICKSLTTSEWMRSECLDYIGECVEVCENTTIVEDLREIFPRESLLEATKRVSPAQRRRLREWVIELNQRAEINSGLVDSTQHSRDATNPTGSVLEALSIEVEFSRLPKLDFIHLGGVAQGIGQAFKQSTGDFHHFGG